MGTLSSITASFGLPVVHYIGSDAAIHLGRVDLCKTYDDARRLLKRLTSDPDFYKNYSKRQFLSLLTKNDDWHESFLDSINSLRLNHKI